MTLIVKSKVFFGLFLLLIYTVSCQEGAVFNKSHEFETGEWDAAVIPEFKVNITEIDRKFDLYTKLNISKQFLTQNLWLFYQVQAPNGNIQYDTTEYILFDHIGKWYGDASGDNILYDLIYKANVNFPEKGEYTFRITQGMRDNQTPLIDEISFIVRKSVYFEGVDR